MRRPLDALPLALLLVLAPACDRTAEPAAPAASAAPATSASAARAPFHIHDRAPPPPTKPADSAAAMLPAASRDPDMGLDPRDPAKDYVTRYLRGTKRYGDKASCIEIGASTFQDKTSVVETHNDATGTCGTPGVLRDRFLVNTATDRMTLDPKVHADKLAAWPDGSDPDAPAGKPLDVQDLRHWKTELRDTFHKLLLAPLRVQLYGRGTYPVITVAGWHGEVLRTMTEDQLAPAAKAICDADGGDALGVFGGLDRATILRITCPGSARFEGL